MKAVKTKATAYSAKASALRIFACWDGVPERAFDNIVRLGVVLDQLDDGVGAFHDERAVAVKQVEEPRLARHQGGEEPHSGPRGISVSFLWVRSIRDPSGSW
jgi:hypothetical protein